MKQVDTTYMSRFLKILFLVTCLGAGALLARKDVLHQAAVRPPNHARASLTQEHEGDEIDAELESYFLSIAKDGKEDVDEQKLMTLFGDDSEKVVEEEPVTSLANRGRLDYMTSYRVRPGDTIWKISRKMSLRPEQILRHNPELKKRPLYIGEEIIIVRKELNKVVSPRRFRTYRIYVVKKGDYLGRIAKKHGVSLKQLCAWNRLKPSSTIRVGQRLKVRSSVRRGPPKGYVYKPLFEWPVRGVITSRYGRRSNPFTRRRQYHKGIDIAAPIGTPFRAARDGVVILSRRMGGYGNCIFIRHADSYVSVYGHSKQNLVHAGDVVKRGQIIGKVGRTGSATGPHLHFEVRKWKRPMNPFIALSMKELVPRQRKVAKR